MMSLSCTFYLLHADNPDENPELWNVFLVFYEGTVGDTDGITDYDLAISQLSDFFMIFSTLIFAIILLNLLVTIIGNIHGDIMAASGKTRLYELINIFVDTNYSLITVIVRLFYEPPPEKQYVIHLHNEKHETKEENIYEGLEKRLEEKTKSLYKENEKMVLENNVNIVKINGRIEDLNEKFEGLEAKIESLLENGLDKLKDYIEKEKKK